MIQEHDRPKQSIVNLFKWLPVLHIMRKVHIQTADGLTDFKENLKKRNIHISNYYIQDIRDMLSKSADASI